MRYKCHFWTTDNRRSWNALWTTDDGRVWNVLWTTDNGGRGMCSCRPSCVLRVGSDWGSCIVGSGCCTNSPTLLPPRDSVV
ncbi:hypothetical protein BD777DRAFT_121316 [Yarrowia lipolytica]|nr:hypothetical protein BD777DRAFT_121316 [Yarrowia lipolytica]